jgi:hypothetical protein
MERNVQVVRDSAELREAAQALVHRAVDLAHLLVTGIMHQGELHRGGRKAHELEVEEEQRR